MWKNTAPIFLFNLQLIFGGRMYTNFEIEILLSTVLVIWVCVLMILVYVFVFL